MNKVVTLSVENLRAQVEAIYLMAGLNAAQAASISRVIVAGERDDCKSHGIFRVEGTLSTIKAGKVRRDARPRFLTGDSDAIIRVNADGGFANPAFDFGLGELAVRARRLGMAALVINDCTHFSALWHEVEAVANEGLTCIAMCPSYSAVAPTGGNQALLGTNPFAFGWPRPQGHPYVFDFATSIVARGDIELYRRAGKSLPEGWAIDADGQPTTDPDAAMAGAMLPFGGHKGSAIGTMIELLSAAMIGDMNSREALEYLGTTALSPRHGELIIAFSPGQFSAGRPGNPFARAEAIFEAIVGQGARLPSQRRFQARERAEKEGISLTVEEVAMLERLHDQAVAGNG